MSEATYVMPTAKELIDADCVNYQNNVASLVATVWHMAEALIAIAVANGPRICSCGCGVMMGGDYDEFVIAARALGVID